MLTAALTLAIGAILGAFGVKPGSYLIVVAGVIKVCLIAVGVIFGTRWARRRGQKP